jgi:protein SCO1/2
MRLRVLILPLLLLVALPLVVAASAPDISGLAYEQRPGTQLPREDMFRDDTGRMVRLDDLFDATPLVLVLGYFHCPNLCSVVRADLFEALRASGMMAGRDYAVVALSIDPLETSADAAAAKGDDLQRHSGWGAAQNWHYLTGTFDAVQAVAKAVGFHQRFDPERKQFAHPVGIVFATPAGLVSSYLLGVGYLPADVRRGVTQAAGGRIAAVASPVLLLCYDYNPATGRYTLAIMKLLRLAAAITAAALAGALFLALRREKRRA